MAVRKYPPKTKKYRFLRNGSALVALGRSRQLRMAGRDICESYKSIAASLRDFWLRKTPFFVRPVHVRANPYLCALAPTVRKYHPEPKNEDFLEMGDSWSALDGSVDSVRPAGTFVGHTNRLRCRYASRSLQKRDFWRRAGAL